jgi:hypothetical protein
MRFSRQFTRIGLPRWAAETKDAETPPNIGQVSELIRNTLTENYDIYPPNLSTEINPDNSIVITAVNPDTKLNLRLILQNLAGDFVHPEGQMTGVVPPSPDQGQLPAQVSPEMAPPSPAAPAAG